MDPSQKGAGDAAAVERAVLRHADALGVDYEAVRIDPAYANTRLFCERYGYTMEQSANCIVVVGKTAEPSYAACVVQATRRLDVNGTVRRLLGARKASFAAAEDTVRLTGMVPDGVTPLGLPSRVPVYVDEPVVGLGAVVVGGGSRSLKLVLPGHALEGIGQVVPGLSK